MTSLIVGSLLCGAALASVPSCGDDAGTGAGGAGSTVSSSSSGGGDGPIAIDCKGAPAELSLTGIWAAYGRLAINMEGAPGGAISICPEDQVGESTLLLLVTVKQDPVDATKIEEARVTLCSIHLPIVTALVGTCDPSSKSLVSTQIVVPETLIKALPKLLTEPFGGALAGTSDGAGIDLERFTVTAGTTKSGDAMPKWDVGDPACGGDDIGRTKCEPTCVDDCAAMRDDEGDQYPGVTVQVCGVTQDDIQKNLLCDPYEPNQPGTTLQGQAFVDLQVDPKFTGTVKNSCEILGSVDTDVLYNVIGADIFLKGGAIGVTSAIQSLPIFNVDPKESKFRMIRIDGQYGAPDWGTNPLDPEAACATLIQRENEL
jgi:hypothetical protein